MAFLEVVELVEVVKVTLVATLEELKIVTKSLKTPSYSSFKSIENLQRAIDKKISVLNIFNLDREIKMKLTPKTVVISIIAAPFALTNIFLVVALPISIVEVLQNPKTFSKASVTPSVTPSPIATPSVTPSPIATPFKGVTSEGFHYIFDGKQYVPDPDFADKSTKASAQVDDDPALKYALEAKKTLELAKEDAELAEIEAAMMSTPEAKADLKLQKARAEAFDAMIEQDQKDNPERWVNSTPYVKTSDRYKNR